MIVRRCTALIVLALVVTACGASAREKTISATFTSLDAASKAFAEFDIQHQHEILARNSDKATYDKEITAYRAVQLKVEMAFAGAYRATASAAMLDNDPSLNGMLQAAAEIAQELTDLGVKIPGAKLLQGAKP